MSVMANFQPNIFGEEAPGVYWLPRGTIGSKITFPFFLAGPTCSPSDVTISPTCGENGPRRAHEAGSTTTTTMLLPTFLFTITP